MKQFSHPKLGCLLKGIGDVALGGCFFSFFSGDNLFGNVHVSLEALAISVPNARLAPASGHVPGGRGELTVFLVEPGGRYCES